MDNPVLLSARSAVTKEKTAKLKEDSIKTIFIVTSKAVYREPYLRLVKAYEDVGMKVKSIHIEKLDQQHIKFVNNTIKEINNSFKKGGCQIISFGRSYAGIIVSCFFVSSGNKAEDAIERLQKINKNLIVNEEEVSFIYQFNDFLRPDEKTVQRKEIVPEKISVSETKAATVAPAIQETPEAKIEPKGEEEVPSQKTETEPPPEVVTKKEKKAKKKKKEDRIADVPEHIEEIEEEEIIDKMPVDIEAYKGLQYGKFYQSIRFKLISIMSFIIVVSITVMIFIATYFFIGDNEIRINENNLKISEVTSLKVKSDFQSIIDKSKLLANAMMQNIGKKDIEKYIELIQHNDRDFIFFGMAVPSKKRKSLKFIKSSYNRPLMAESQIRTKDIRTIHRINKKIFDKSFRGDIVIHNVSPGFKQAIIGLSIPFHKSPRGKVRSILVSYIKLDKFLKAFKASGITKTFMVNDSGDIIAHPDSAIVVSGGNYINLPIVKMMIKSTLNNGQTRYQDEGGIFHLGSFKKIGIGGCGVIATVEENRAFQAIYDMQRRNIYLMVIVLTSVILIIYFFAKTLTTPIISLVKATKLIKEGRFNVNIIPSTKDEIGELTSSFIEMGQGLEEREKMKDAFGKFVNKEIAEQVLKGEVQLGGERKTAAVFFSDIRAFTAISENLEPEEVVEFLNEYMTRMVQCVNVTNGVVDKYIGDAIMAEWGVPISYGNDTENAINSALMMRKSLIDFNRGRGTKKKPFIQIGCGINTGPVLAGQIGSEDRMEYTVIGDAVNLASRIEALNKPFGTDILISEDSYTLVKDIFEVEKMSPIKVKGKEEPQQIFSVLGRTDDPERPRNNVELRKVLGIAEQPFKRRWNDEEVERLEDEVKYEILEQPNK